jgi:hypothetical protein
MTSKLLATTAIATGMALWASAALADPTLYIGASEADVDGGALQQLATGASRLAIHNISFGTFNITTIGGEAAPQLTSPDLSLTDVSITNSNDGDAPYSKGTITIWLSETGLTSPTGAQAFLSTLDYNMNKGTIIMSGATYYDNSDAIFGQANLLGTFGPITATAGSPTENGSPESLNSGTPEGTYSITEEITLDAPNTNLDWANNSGISIDAVQVPEPASLSLLGGGLVAFGAWRRRNRRKA